MSRKLVVHLRTTFLESSDSAGAPDVRLNARSTEALDREQNPAAGIGGGQPQQKHWQVLRRKQSLHENMVANVAIGTELCPLHHVGESPDASPWTYVVAFTEGIWMNVDSRIHSAPR